MSSLDEFEIIRIFTQTLGQPKYPFSMIGDDVSHFPAQKGRVVVKSDMLVRRTDVPEGMKLWQVARKSVVMCVSDFAAKGVEPQAALISLGIPKGFTKRQVIELANGFKRAKNEFGIEVLGGDTNEADDLVVDCTMLGFAEKIVQRNGAKVGDLVVTSGLFGYSAAGLRMLLQGYSGDRGFHKRALDAVFMPFPRLKFGLSLKEYLSASIDSSDGLALSLHQLAESSHVGMSLHKVPTTREVNVFCERCKLDPKEVVLYGGEEYEIVATVHRRRLNKAKIAARRARVQLHLIGEVTDQKGGVQLRHGRENVPLERRGWVHFR